MQPATIGLFPEVGKDHTPVKTKNFPESMPKTPCVRAVVMTIRNIELKQIIIPGKKLGLSNRHTPTTTLFYLAK